MSSIFCEYTHISIPCLHLDTRSFLSNTSNGSLPVVGRYIQQKSSASTASLSIAQMTKQCTNFHVDFLFIFKPVLPSHWRIVIQCIAMSIVHPLRFSSLLIAFAAPPYCALHSRVKMRHLQNPTLANTLDQGPSTSPSCLFGSFKGNFQTQH